LARIIGGNHGGVVCCSENLSVFEALAVAEVLYLREHDKIDAVIIASDVPEV
jgi:hypothetical protein